MSRRNLPEAEPLPFAALSVRHITVGRTDERIAVHISGRLDTTRPPLICVAGYHRNMADFASFVPLLRERMVDDWPLVLVDLRGRGRSADRRRADDYVSPRDAEDLSQVMTALGIGRAVWLGQGYGGQVLMTLAVKRPGAVAGTILIDAGPLSDSRGLVRMRINLAALSGLRGEAARQRMFRQVLAADYPALGPAELEALADRTHYFDRKGRNQPLFDPRLINRLDDIDYDDVLMAQWPLFDALAETPMLLFRTQLTDQLRRETFDEMRRRRPDATALIILDQGSPALLDHPDEVGAIVEFVRKVAAGEEPEPMLEGPISGGLVLAE